MRGLLLWFRQLWFTLPMFLVLQVVNLLNSPGVEEDWSYMLSAVGSVTMLASPMSAGVIAYWLFRRWSPDTRIALAGINRPERPVMEIVGVVWVYGVLAQLIALGVGAWLCLRADADPRGVSLPGQLLVGPAALAAGCCVGALAMVVFPRLVTIPILMIMVFLANWAFDVADLPDLLSVSLPAGAVTGARIVPQYLYSAALGNLAVSAGALAATVWLCRPRGYRPAGALIGVLVAGGVFTLAIWWDRTLPPGLYQ